MHIRTIRINGVDVDVQVDDIDKTAGDLELTSRIGASILDSGDEIRRLLGAVSTSVHEAFAGALPAKWGIELTLGFKGETGVPFLAKGEANGAVKVSVTWKKA